MSRPGGEARSILVEPAIANFYARAFSRSPIRPCGAAQSAHRIADYRRLRRRSPGSAISEMEWHGDGDRDAKQGQPASRCTHRDRRAALHLMRTPAWRAHRDAPHMRSSTGIFVDLCEVPEFTLHCAHRSRRNVTHENASRSSYVTGPDLPSLVILGTLSRMGKK